MGARGLRRYARCMREFARRQRPTIKQSAQHRGTGRVRNQGRHGGDVRFAGHNRPLISPASGEGGRNYGPNIYAFCIRCFDPHRNIGPQVGDSLVTP